MTYRRERGEWMCTALEFDIVGTGKTKQEAFDELRALVETYLLEVMDTDAPVEFYNPADAEEWECKDRKSYRVAVIMARAKEDTSIPPRMVRDITKLRPYRDRIRGVDLELAGV